MDIFLNPIKLSYNDGICPDCGDEIPDDVVEGQGCTNCGHAFYEEMNYKDLEITKEKTCI